MNIQNLTLLFYFTFILIKNFWNTSCEFELMSPISDYNSYDQDHNEKLLSFIMKSRK